MMDPLSEVLRSVRLTRYLYAVWLVGSHFGFC
jgi:hypothetical protein